MKRIKTTGRVKSGKGYRVYALFECDICHNQVERIRQAGDKMLSCGCLGKGRDAHDKAVAMGLIPPKEEEMDEIILRNTNKKERACLMCGRLFMSSGPNNRRCPVCDRKIEVAADATYWVPTVYSVVER